MAGKFSFSEQVDMLLVLGFCEGNCRRSVEEYRRRYPDRVIPHRETFSNVERRARETGKFSTCTRERAIAIRDQDEERILNTVEDEPRISTRNVSRQTGISKSSIHRVLKRNLLHPYHAQKVQELLPEDLDRRVTFCRFILRQEIHFQKKILFTDEASFTRRGITNVHNYHEYSDVNPKLAVPRHFQREFSINVWIGIIDRYLIGPVIMPNRLNGDNYLDFLQNTLPDLLEDLPLQLRREHWFMHDGAPPHFSVHVRNFLNQQYPNKWIGRGNNCPQKWPTRSPDLNKCDFFLWGMLKDYVYSSPVASRAEVWNRITNKCNVIRNDHHLLDRVDFNFRRRINLCLRENGAHFQQHLK